MKCCKSLSPEIPAHTVHLARLCRPYRCEIDAEKHNKYRPRVSSSPRFHWALVLPSIVALLAFANTLTNGFALDDYHFVLRNTDVTGSGFNISLARATVTEASVFFRPTGMVTYWIDYRLWGDWAGGYHLTSMLFHAVATSLLTLFVHRIAGVRAAVCAGLIFAAHPVHVEAVSAVANRTEVLAAMFALAVLAVHVGRSEDSWKRVVAENGLAFVALLSKESAITLPGLIVAVDFFDPSRRLRVWSFLRLLPAVILYLALRQHALGEAGIDPDVSFFAAASLFTRLNTVVVMMGRYGLLLLMPSNLTAIYHQPLVTELGWSVLGGVVVIVVTIGSSFVLRRRAPWLAAGAALMGLAMFPYLHIAPLMVPMAERFLYLPSIGFALAGGFLLASASRRVGRRPLSHLLVAAITLSLLGLTMVRNLDWSDPLTLWSKTVETTPDSPLAHANLGLTAFHVGDTELAVVELEAALALAPQHTSFRATLAQVHHFAGDHDKELGILLDGLSGEAEIDAELIIVIEQRRSLHQPDSAAAP